VDSYRKRRRIAVREVAVEVRCRSPLLRAAPIDLPAFDQLIADLPASQREVLTMLKVNGLSLEEVARATSSSVGSVKQKAHRAYERLRGLLQSPLGGKGFHGHDERTADTNELDRCLVPGSLPSSTGPAQAD
jgi:RNA polymerase sigma-70 factor (ECF subfamily)